MKDFVVPKHLMTGPYNLVNRFTANVPLGALPESRKIGIQYGHASDPSLGVFLVSVAAGGQAEQHGLAKYLLDDASICIAAINARPVFSMQDYVNIMQSMPVGHEVVFTLTNRVERAAEIREML